MQFTTNNGWLEIHWIKFILVISKNWNGGKYYQRQAGSPVTVVPQSQVFLTEVIHVFRDMIIHTCHTNCHTKLRQYFLICFQFFDIFLWLTALSQNVTKDPNDIDKTTKNEIATIFDESFDYRYGKIEYIQKRIHIAIMRDSKGKLLEISYSLEIRSVTKGTFKLTDLECTCKSQRILLRRMWVLFISAGRAC